MNIKALVRSFIFAALSILLIMVVNFVLPRLMPGDPVYSLIGAEEQSMTQEEYDYYYHEMGLDKPKIEQLGDYMKGIFNGDLGYSYYHGRKVSELIEEKIPKTLQITFPAWLISALLAYSLGVAAGKRRNQLGDGLLTSGVVVINTIPTFLVAIFIAIIFAFELKWFPSGSLNSIEAPNSGWDFFVDRLYHLFLPVLTLVIASTGGKYLMMRNTTAQAMDEKYVIYAKARGLSNSALRFRHIFTNIGQPFISMLGTSFGKMLSGSIVIEMIFSIDGMGLLVNKAIMDHDFPVLQAALFVIAVSVILANLISDIICILLDPRQRLGETK